MRMSKITIAFLLGWSSLVFGYSANDDISENDFEEPKNTHGNLTRFAIERSELSNAM